MPYYESVFIARQEMTSSQVEALADTLTGVVQERGGTVAKRELWGLKNLSYRIKKNRKGHYVLFNIDAPYDAVAEMERQMRLSEDVLRYMTLKVDELEEGPSAMMQARAARDERDRRDRRDRDRPRDGYGDRESAPPVAAEGDRA